MFWGRACFVIKSSFSSCDQSKLCLSDQFSIKWIRREYSTCIGSIMFERRRRICGARRICVHSLVFKLGIRFCYQYYLKWIKRGFVYYLVCACVCLYCVCVFICVCYMYSFAWCLCSSLEAI